MSAPLQDKLAIVTGGSRGIGLAIATKLAGLGAELVITARKQGELDKAAGQIRKVGGKCDGIRCDVSSLSEVQQFVFPALIFKNERHGDRPCLLCE